MLSECFKMVPLLFVFSICYLAFMCNTECDMETSIISFLTCFDFEFNADNSKLTRSTQTLPLQSMISETFVH